MIGENGFEILLLISSLPVLRLRCIFVINLLISFASVGLKTIELMFRSTLSNKFCDLIFADNEGPISVKYSLRS